MERMVPSNKEAECGLLGSILIDGAAYDQVAGMIRPDDFYENVHRVIYQAMQNLASQRMPVDVITVIDELERTDKMKDVVCANKFGGSAYISHLTMSVPTSGNIGHYAQIIVRLSQCRKLITAAGQIAQMAYSGDEKALETSEQLLYQLHRASQAGGWVSLQNLMNEYMEELDFLHTNRGAIAGIPTGYPDLDTCLGGLQRTDLILLAARPSMGKTSLALCMAYNAALRGYKIAVFSLEMGRRLLARRLMAMHSKVDMQRLRNGWIEDDEWEQIIDASQNLSELPIWINDTAGSPIASMRSEMRRMVHEQGGLDMVVVDYVGLIEPDTEADKKANLVQQISQISKGLKALAREFDVPVVALCQLSRAVESRRVKIPMLSDLRDSGSLEQDADVVLFIYRDDYYAKLEDRVSESPNIATVYVAKQRNGPTGEVNLFFQANQTMFYPLEVTTPPEE